MLWHIIQNVIGLTIAFREFATANPDIEDSTQGNVHPCKYHQPGNRGGSSLLQYAPFTQMATQSYYIPYNQKIVKN